MPGIEIKFGRLIQNVGETALPMRLCPAARNIDIATQNYTVSRRQGYQRALSSTFNGPVYFHRKFQDVDGTDLYVVIDDGGVNRVES